MNLHTYLPQDRLRAIANHSSLRERTSGSALFADISGFTALTESLRETFGSRKGAEELSSRLDDAFTILIAEVERYGGSVIDFAGDSITCLFDGKGSALRAIHAGLGMQSGFANFNDLFLKISIASGAARRFAVGDPSIQRIDTLAGNTVIRAALGEHSAGKGEVLVDEVTVQLLGDALKVSEWREVNGDKFALAKELTQQAEDQEITKVSFDPSILKEWVLPHLQGRDDFLSEFRPSVALFVRFTGIDFEADDARNQLDGFVREMQKSAARYDGVLLQLTIGDKGSYAYINFGAVNAHEDDSHRAVKTALELRKKTELKLQMGISQGVMLVGAYGGVTRKAFGALGDDVNLAARLMTTAKENEILLSSDVHKAVMGQFTFEPHPPVPMKGKAEPLPVFVVTGENQKRAVRLQEPSYSLPMVGRQAELKLIEERLELAAQGKSQVVAVVAEAGLGKSRLVAEVIRLARKKGFVGYGGACQSDAIHTPYQAWKSIWGAFFDVDHEMALKRQMRLLEGDIEDRAPSRVNAMPLLNVVLDLNIPENDFTQNLEPKIRQSALHALLEDCLKSAAGRGAVPAPDEGANDRGGKTLRQAQDNASPLLIVIEDLHWIDALSHDLLEGLAKALANYAVCFVLAYRPLQMERLQNPRIEALAQFTRIELHELTQAEATLTVRAKLRQLYPARGEALPAGLVEALMRRAQGNPFYLEELLNYVRDRGLDPADLQRIELPDSLHTLILSRIDQLSEREKTTLRAASIVGRLFRAKWLTGYYPESGSFPQVKAALDALSRLDITPLDSPEPELAYLFKHIVTHEVTYESLPFATRARLHEQLAVYLESIVEATHASPLLDVIVFHYLRSENQAKQMEYLRKAGEASQKNYANDAALDYYGSLLPLLIDVKEKAKIHLRRGEVLELIGNYDDAESDYRAALDSAKDDRALIASVQYALGKLNRMRGNYGPALEWLVKAKETYTALRDNVRLAQVLVQTGTVLSCEGDLTQAGELCNKGLILAREVGDSLGTALALTELGDIAWQQGDRVAARTLAEEGLNLRRAMGDKSGIARSLLQLGNVVCEQGDYATARMLYEESLSIRRGIGDKPGIADSLYMLGKLAYWQGEYVAARASYEESLSLCREMGDKTVIALALNNLGNVASAQSDYAAAQALHEESLRLCREIGFKLGSAIALVDMGYEAYLQGDYIKARASCEECLALCKAMDEKQVMAYALLGLGLLDLTVNKPEAREQILHSLRMRWDTDERLQQTSSLIGAAGLVLHEGNPQFAAELLGAVEFALKGLGAVMEPELKPFHTRTLEAARGQLGKAAFQSAWEEGSQWSLEEAVKKALGE